MQEKKCFLHFNVVECSKMCYGFQKKNLIEIKSKVKIFQDKFFDVLAKMKQHKWKLELTQKWVNKQFWCLEQKFKESKKLNFYTQVQETTNLKKKIIAWEMHCH